MKWFSQAEVFRQNGFYSDMNGNLTTPLKITDEQFEEARVRIERVNKVIRHTIDAFLSEDAVMLKSIEHIKNQFIESNFYELISNKLTEMRKGKKSFFEGFQKTFFDPLADRNERKELKEFANLLNKQRTEQDILNDGNTAL